MCMMFWVLHFWMIWKLYSIPAKMATNPKHGQPLLYCKSLQQWHRLHQGIPTGSSPWICVWQLLAACWRTKTESVQCQKVKGVKKMNKNHQIVTFWFNFQSFFIFFVLFPHNGRDIWLQAIDLWPIKWLNWQWGPRKNSASALNGSPRLQKNEKHNMQPDRRLNWMCSPRCKLGSPWLHSV